jgi:COP9 signalosome complex subunit 6
VFELAFANGALDEGFLSARLDQCSFPPLRIRLTGIDKQIFPNLDFVGWFTTAALSPSTMEAHRLFTSLNPLPILLILDPSGLSAPNSDTLPIKVYESIPTAGAVDVGEVEFRLETGEAERIGVEHVSKPQQASDTDRTEADERTFSG